METPVTQTSRAHQTVDGIRIYDPQDFAGMQAAGALAARILDEIADHVAVGQTTGALNRLIEKMVTDAGAKSATIGYKGYQHASCISVNHVVCHGIPGDKKLKDGDILNIDVTVIVDGWYGDSSRMYVAGTLSRKAERLLQVTHDALMEGIAAGQLQVGWKRSAGDRVKISQPEAVIPTECSNCAESDLSRVTAVQSSASTLVSALPRFTIGSMVKNMPGSSTGPVPGRP